MKQVLRTCKSCRCAGRQSHRLSQWEVGRGTSSGPAAVAAMGAVVAVQDGEDASSAGLGREVAAVEAAGQRRIEAAAAAREWDIGRSGENGNT